METSNTRRLAVELAPLIRGASLFRERLVRLSYQPDFIEGSPWLHPDFAQSWRETFCDQIREIFAQCHQEREGVRYPAAINVDGVGCFRLSAPDSPLGTTSAGGWVFKPVLSSRADVVRGKIAVIIGCARGFGAEIARSLVDDGATVVLADVNREGVEELAQQLNRSGKRALPWVTDIGDEYAVTKLKEEVALQFGGLDLLLLSAGIVHSGSVFDLSLDDVDFSMRVNYQGFFLATHHLGELLRAQAQTAKGYFTDIVQLNSKSGLEGSLRNAAYAGSKFGGIGLVQSFALELIEHRIKVNAICPGNYLDGPMWSDPENGLFIKYLQAGKVKGAKTVEDVRRFYLSKVPCQRGCLPADLVRALYYIIEQVYETGQAVPVTGGQLMLN